MHVTGNDMINDRYIKVAVTSFFRRKSAERENLLATGIYKYLSPVSRKKCFFFDWWRSNISTMLCRCKIEYDIATVLE